MKQSKPHLVYLCYFIFSAAAIFFASYIQYVLHWIMFLDNQVNEYLSIIFSASSLGVHLRLITSLVLTPMIIIAIPAIAYQLIKKKTLPYLFPITWLFWLITALSRLLIEQGLYS